MNGTVILRSATLGQSTAQLIDATQHGKLFGRPTDVRFTPQSGHQNWLGLRSAHQLRQLGDVRRDPPRLVGTVTPVT